MHEASLCPHLSTSFVSNAPKKEGHRLFEADCLMSLPAALAPFPSPSVFMEHGINYI